MGPWNPLDAFEASAMALSIEVDAVLVSMLPFGPRSRSTDRMGKERSWSVIGLGGHLTASLLEAFRCLFGLERRFRA